jgi:lysylphosphatidylglycerol synthetase-like protein (DUF2156 family)
LDQKLALILAFIFGTVFLAAMLVLAVAMPSPTPSQIETFRIITALGAGGVAAVIPGLLGLRLAQGRTFAVSASGALAVFVIVYFYSPAHWVVDASSAGTNQINQNTSGPCSPSINAAHDVTVNCSSGK